MRVLCAILLATLSVAPASATVIPINSKEDELNSDGDCTLREAVEAANTNQVVDACPAGEPGHDYIVVAVPVLDPTLRLELGELVLTEAVTIDGRGSPTVTIKGDLARRLFRIPAGVGLVTITGMRLSDGRASCGGVVLVESGAEVLLHNLVIERSYATGTGGGGVCNLGGTVSIQRAVIKTSHANGAMSAGGGIYNVGGSLTLRTVTLWRNDASSVGGAIYSRNSNLVLDDVLLDENDAGSNPGYGGGLYTRGGSTRLLRSGALNNRANRGGAVWSDSPLIARGVLLRDNEAPGTGLAEGGGGLYIAGSTAAITGSTFWANTAASGAGGGIHNAGGTLTVAYSTFSGNTAGWGGGLYNAAGTADLANTTVALNAADSTGGGLFGVETARAGGTLTLANTIVGDNDAPTGPDCAGAIRSAGYDVFEEAEGCAITLQGKGTLIGQDPGLAPLADNGGQTLSHDLLPGSPARDLGGTCGPFDQRGLPAPAPLGTGGVCDAGSVEAGSSGVPVVVRFAPVDSLVVIPAEGGSFLFTFTVENVTGTVQAYDIWTEATYPDSSVVSPLLGPGLVTLAPYETQVDTLEQFIPAAAPAGAYTYTGLLGRFPTGVLASGRFPFLKEEGARRASRSPAGEGADGWRVVRVSGGRPFGPDEAAASAAASTSPEVVALVPARPNPFAARTALAFDLPEAAHVRLAVYDVLGRELAVLVDEVRQAGRHEAVLEAGRLPSGTFVVRLEAGPVVRTQRVTLLR